MKRSTPLWPAESLAMAKIISLETYLNERQPQNSRLGVIAERLSYVIEYLAGDDLRNWAAADLRACSEVSPQDLTEMESVISAAFLPVHRRAPQSAGMRGLAVRQ